jgi:uracil-DNA glycosylase family 4
MKWKDKIRNPTCELCPLHESATYVCLMGSGTRQAKIMIVGEAPGEREDDSAQAFVGPSGHLLRTTLADVGIEAKDCYITNVCKCRPPGNRTPELSEIKTCVSAYLTAEIRKIAPTHMLLLGGSALRGVVGKQGIGKHRGTVFSVGGAEAFATFHPAYVLRSPFAGPTFRADIQRFARMVDGGSIAAAKTKVKIIRELKQLKWLRRKLMTVKEISWDLETYTDGTSNNFREWHPDSKIVSIAFSWEEGQAVVVPIHHVSKPWKNPDAILRSLKPCLERPDAKYIAHNGPFDARWLASRGIFVRQTFDTLLSGHMLDENRAKGLKPRAQTELGVDAWDVGVEVSNAYYEDLRKLCIYNGNDTDYALRLYHKDKEELKKEPRIARVFAKLMMPAANAFTPVELGGVWIDPERYDKRLQETVAIRDQVESDLRKSAGTINLRSPDQVATWLFGKRGRKYKVGSKRAPAETKGLGLTVVERSPKTKKPATNEKVILKLAQKNPEVRKLLEYRKWELKYLRTYFAQWSVRDADSRFHPGYKIFGTVTGRISGDFQQVPRDPFMRSIIGAPPGWLFLEADFSQIELRLAAWIANEERLLRLFAMGQDAHLNTAVEITGKRPQDITSEERKHGKSVNFGFLYSMGPKKFVEYAFQNYELIIPLSEAQVYYDRFHKSYPAIRRWHDRQRRLVHRYERVHSPIGRVRHLPTVRSSDSGVRLEAERQAINSPVQSFASDFTLLSLVRLTDGLPSTECRIVGTVHDSLLFQIRHRAVDDLVPYIKETMEDTSVMRKKFGCDVTVPIIAEVKLSEHWGE